MTNKTILQASGLQKNYPQGNTGNILEVIKNIDLEILEGEKLAIIGVSGSGKSTLLNLLGGLDDSTQGTVTLNGKQWSQLSPTDRAAWRNQHIGFVYQFHHLLNEFSALENVSLPNLISGKASALAQQEAIKLLTKVGLSDRLHHRPAELSGGERQRVAIARALACKPSLVLMDEPTGNLDPKTADAVLDLLMKLNKDLGISLVVVTHDPLIAQRMDRTVRLEEGLLEPQLV
jgi:lipoprotein-releasing system ATP-binding protein